MTQQEKQLLINYLCARLPYGVMFQSYHSDCGIEGKGTFDFEIGDDATLSKLKHLCESGNNKPYLRPMSSMTDDEREEIEIFIFNKWYEEDSCKIDKEGWIEILANYDVSGIDPGFCADYVDWLNAHHFDYRGLIEKGLALEAPDGMYKSE